MIYGFAPTIERPAPIRSETMHLRTCFSTIFVPTAVCILTIVSGFAAADDKINFNRDIRPILSD